MSEYEFLGKYDHVESNQGRKRRGKRGRRQRDPKAPKSCIGRIIDFTLWTSFFGLIILVTAMGATYYFLNAELEAALSKIENFESAAGGTPRFFDRKGNLIYELPVTEQRQALTWNVIPDYVKQATVAVEDDTFWENYGVDPAAIGAALWANSQSSGRPIGASTITQQLVRHIAFSYEERTSANYDRKVKEILLSLIITSRKHKEEILALYLNEIYYGNRAYGIGAAAQTYFGKDVASLTLAESAYLAAIPQAPTTWNPYTNSYGVKERQHLVLDLMAEDGAITLEEAALAKIEPLTIQPLQFKAADSDQLKNAPHFVLYVMQQIEARYGPRALELGGWQVTTTLDLEIQQMAEAEARARLAAWGPSHNASNAAVVILKPQTSEILSMVGSLDYFNETIDGQVNMAIAPRQPGSTFKPITYAAAMDRGWGPTDVLWDVPIELELSPTETMKPTNYDNRFHGPLLLRDALANSYNVPPLMLARDIGVPAVIQTGRQMGLHSLTKSADFYGLSLTLGGGEVPLIEMTHVYGTFAAEGKYSRLNSIVDIRDNLGRSIYNINGRPIRQNQVIDPAIAWLMSDMLNDNRARTPSMGGNSVLQRRYPVAVKTGTSNDFRDNLTIGYTPNVVVGVWMGNSDSRLMSNTSGLTGTGPLWASIMDQLQLNESYRETLMVGGLNMPTEFVRPGTVIDTEICLPRGSGGTNCTSKRTEPVVANAPSKAIARFSYIPNSSSQPGAWTLNVMSLPAEEAANISQPAIADDIEPPTPKMCVVNGQRDGSQTRLYLRPPPHYDDEVRARLWANQNGYSGLMAPPVNCPLSVIRSVQETSDQ
ncbi:MAG: transglycosylase domain-containing protein [Chloroflexota bacterium]